MFNRLAKPILIDLMHVVLLMLLILGLSVPAYAEMQPQGSSVPAPERVVLLYSYGDGIPAYQQATRGFLSVMKEGGVSVNNLFFEYLDLERKKDKEHKKNLVTLFRHKYEGKKIDLLVTVHTQALKFILSEGKDLFPGAPVLSYLAPDMIETAGIERRVLLLPMKMDFKGTLELALKLFPQTQRVVFINGVGEGEKRLEVEARSVFLQWSDKLEFEYTSDLSVEEMLERIANLPSRTIVFYSNVFRDKTGRTFVPRDVAEMVAKASNAPVFGMYNTILENGIIGGSVFNFQIEGARAAAVALDTLRGKLSLTKPVTILAASRTPMFDWQQLKRWGVNEIELPKETIFVNRIPSFWAQHKRLVMGVILFILVQSILIVVLVLQIRRKKLAEESLQQKKEELDQFFYISLDLMCIANTDGYFLRLNPAWERVLGYPPEELMAKRFLEFVHPDDLDRTREAISTLASQEQVTFFENRYRHKDGTYRWLQWSSAPAGTLIYAAARDVTEHKRAEEALWQSEKEAQRIANEALAMAEIGRIIASTLTIEEVYESFAAVAKKIIPFDRIVINMIDGEKSTVKNVYMAGEEIQDREVEKVYPLEGSGNAEMVRTKSTFLLQTEDFREYKDRFPMLLSTFEAGFRSIMNVPLFSKGEVIGGLLLRSLEPYAYTDEDVRLAERIGSQIAGAIANAQLFLKEKQREEALRESEDRFRQVAENVGDFIWEVDANGLYRYTSPSVEKILGYMPGELIGKMHFYDLFAPGVCEELKTAAFKVFAAKEAFRAFPNPNVSKEGEVVHLETSGVPVLDADGNLVGYRGADTDITERKLAEKELKERLRFERLISDLSASLVNVPPDKVESEINKGLRNITEFFDADRCTIGLFSGDGTRLVSTFEYHAAEAEPAPQFLSKELTPWYVEQLIRGNWIMMNRVEDLPPEAEKERQLSLSKGMKSVLSIPLVSGGKTLGSFALVSTRAERVWPEEYVPRLRLLGEILVNVLERERAEEASRESERILRQNENDLRRLAGRLISAQEEERSRLARELHDDLAQRLAVFAIDVGKLEQQLMDQPAPVQEELREMKKDIVRLSQDVHSLSRQLHPSILDDLGLIKAVESECTNFSRREGVDVVFDHENISTVIPKDVSLSLYRIIQEGLRNISKHACANRIAVSLRGVDHDVLLSVQDDGIGFDSAEVREEPGLGLSSMRERVRLIHGELSIESQPEKGTLITVRVPLTRGGE